MNSLRILAEAKGWEYHNNFLYLRNGAYHFTVKRFVDHMRAGNGWILVYVPTHTLTSDQKHLLSHYIKENQKELKIASHQFSENVLIMRLFIPYLRLRGEQLEFLCDRLVKFMEENEFCHGERCVYCGDQGIDAVTKIHRIAYPAHQTCIDNA